jgi:RHS repeat-associated protein
MTQPNCPTRFSFVIPFHQLFIALSTATLLLVLTTASNAQTTNPTDGSTPAGLTPGAPAGSYGLSGFDNVNLYNGNMNFRLPLISMGGRGGAGYTVTLPIEQHWTVDKYTDPDDPASTTFMANGNWWEVVKPGYYPGVMQRRMVGSLTTNCGTQSHPIRVWQKTVTRLTFTANDGTEYELVDQLSGGAFQFGSTCTRSRSRGKVFISHDGSGATFVSDSDVVDPYYGEDGATTSDAWTDTDVSGYLFLRDGTRYRIDGGYVTQMRDRNGNNLTFTSDSNFNLIITDSLNRQVTFNYDYQDAAPYGLCDRITFKGFGGATRIIRVSKTALGNALKAGSSSIDFAGLSGGGGDPTVVSAVWLPNDDSLNRHYQFYYNSYSELARVELPTGGAFEYDWDQGLTTSYSSGGLFWDGTNSTWQIFRRVVEKRVLPDGTHVEGRTTFSRPETCSDAYCTGGITNLGYVDVDEKDASSNLLARQRHYFNGGGAAHSMSQHPIVSAIVDDMEGRETQTDSYDSNGTTLLRHAVNTWEAATVLGQGPHVTEVDTTLSDTNQVAKETFAYDTYGNRTDSYEYDYGSGAAGSLARHTQTGFVTTLNGSDYACDRSTTCGSSASVANVIHLRSLPTQTSVYDSGGTERSRVTFEYDNYASDTNHAGLVDRTSISGLDSAFTTSYTTRGNGTASTHYLLVSGSVAGSITAYAQFDIAGNAWKVIDAHGNSTTFEFTDKFGTPDGDTETNTAPTELSTPGLYSYAFATKVTNAANQIVHVQFDFDTGRPVNAEDVNGIVSRGYSDSETLDRPTKIIRASGVTGVQSQTTFAYDDANRTVTTTSDLTSNTDGLLVTKGLYDGLGRTTESRQYEGSSHYIAVQTQYDALGRAYKVSNPFRPLTPDSETAVWTTSAFDALGRVVSVTTPDSAVVTSSYSGNTVTATDQASKARKSVSDALGRLTTIYEDPSSLNYSTSYSYDVLNDLTQVSQGSQTRTFAYDSLKRLTSATNPESGTVSYTYDNNGNLLTRTDQRSITTTIAYDVLNRPTSKSYDDSPQTPTVNFYYDSQTLPSGAPSFTRGYSTGALVAITYGGGSAGTYRGFDALGRVVRQYQQTDSVNYLVEATYNVNGSVATETYPSVPGASDRRTVTYTPDSAGRLSSLSSSATSYAPAASVSSILYAPQSALKTETYGNSLIHAVSYNNRLQPTEIKLGTSGNSTSVIDLNYSYGTTANNGDVLSYTYGGGGLSYTQSFGYDSLNRLSSATETNGGTTNWTQNNAYDRYGNRQIDYGGGSYNLTFSSTTNRITTSGFSYDSNGNLTNDTIHAYTFDAENKILKVDSTTAYTYDGAGQRVRKLVGENTRFIYGIGGQLIAEYDGSTGNLKKEYVAGGGSLITIEPTAVNSNGTQYTTPDNLGSPRVITNSSASVVGRHDYMPFGEDLGAGTGGRTTGMGFSGGSSDNNRKKFTGYERDTETSLDFAQARYYSNTQGRFTSPDPFAGSATIGNPQTFNRYAYCGNNPVNATDPSGMTAQPGGRNIGNWNGAMASEQASGETLSGGESPSYQPAAVEATKDAEGSAGAEGKSSDPEDAEPQNSQVDVTSLDARTKIFVAVGLGEGTGFQVGTGDVDGYPALSFDQLPKEQKGASSIHFEGQAALGELRLESYFMISALMNDVSAGRYKTLEAAAQGEAVGYATGVERLNQLNSPMYNIRARLMIEQLRNIDASGPNGDANFWRGVAQPGGQRAFRQGDFRAGNTDFMSMNPKTKAYDRLSYWTAKGWKTPRR